MRRTSRPGDHTLTRRDVIARSTAVAVGGALVASSAVGQEEMEHVRLPGDFPIEPLLRPVTNAVWVPGTIAEVEFPERLAPAEPGALAAYTRRGWGVEYFAREGTSNWFHIPIATPIILHDQRTRLEKVFALYRTKGNASITDMHVYDGPNRIKAIKAFEATSYTGDHSAAIDSANVWAFDPPIELYWGVGISLGVQFVSRPSDYAWPSILFTAAGADLLTLEPRSS